VRAKELWRVAPEFLEQAQDDATLLAIRDQERAGLDIITDGEMRRESYSNRFATALEGVDIDNPGTALDRSGHPNPVPRVAGKVRRKHPVEVRDVKFLRANTDRAIKITVPGPFTMSQQAQNDFYEDEEEMALDYAAAVNEEIKDLFAAGADIVQIDEPYMQARPEKAREYGLKALNRRSTASPARPRCTSASAMPRSSTSGRPAIRSCRSSPARRCSRSRSRPRSRARLLGAGDAAGQDDHPRRARPVDMTVETPETVAAASAARCPTSPPSASSSRPTAA
jgi:5-methyltetrahydropteroyltriglutamate--homocysteine methyltransferase